MHSKRRNIFVNTGGQLQSVNIQEINYIQSDGDDIKIITTNKEYLVRDNCSGF